MAPRLVHWGSLGGLLVAAAGGLAAAWWLVDQGILPLAAALALAFALIGLAAALAWLLQDLAWLRPAHALSREIQLLTHAHAGREPEVPRFHGLGELPDALRTLAACWREAQRADDRALRAATERADEQARRLAAVLRDVDHGIIGCSTAHRILLFNDAARRMLGAPAGLGLDRPLDRLLAIEPVRAVLRTLLEARDRPGAGPDAATFVAVTTDGARLLRCRMALLAGDDEHAVQGYLLAVSDAGTARAGGVRDLAAIGRDVRGLRAACGSLVAGAEILGEADLDPDQRARFAGAVEEEGRRVVARIDDLERLLEEIAAEAWPRTDLLSSDLARQVGHHLDERGSDAVLIPVGSPCWLHGDAYHLAVLLEHLALRLVERTGQDSIDMASMRQEQRVLVDLVHDGEPLPQGSIEAWLDEPLPAAAGGGRLRDVVDRNGGEVWAQALPEAAPARAAVRLALPAADRPAEGARAALPPRPEFYDFELLGRTTPATSIRDRPLATTTFVVFDTETTGLDPAGKDQIIQIAAVRIVNRRLLTGETFDRLVDPGRPIPRASIRFHGITQDMVEGRPPIEVVLPQFHGFADGAVLVAHNAAFDLAFIRKAEERAGVSFDQPVLDTLLLSTMLHDHTPEHGLDAIAARFGVTLTDRHRAIGDAIGTAEVFLRMLDLLEARGVGTLGEALDLSERAVAVRRRQAESFGRDATGGVRAADPA